MSPRAAANRAILRIVYLLLVSLVVALVLGACSPTEYQTPITTKTSALVSPETVKAWIDLGLVNGSGYDRVVIIDVTSSTGYSAGHIPGAHFLSSADITQNRREGPALDINMVLDGAHMNALIQKYGIDRNTTIVFTGGTATPGVNNYLSVTRAYWTFRYWGFARERLKLVDGINAAWAAAYGLTTEASPSITPSTSTVGANGVIRTDLRASLPEVIAAAEGRTPNVSIVDFRTTETTGSYAGQRGKTGGIFGAADSVVFEGRIRGARSMNYADLVDAANTYRFKSAADLITLLTGVGINSTSLALVH